MPNPRFVVVVAWRKLSRRSELVADALNGKLWFFKDSLPYARAFAKTLIRCIREKPRLMVVQLPQGPLLLEAYLLKKLIGCRVVADVHTGFLLSTGWKGRVLNAPFVKLLPTADVIVAHNQPQLNLIPANVKNKTIVVFDPWQFIKTQPTKQNKPEKYLVFPASFAPDEPLEEIIDAINKFNINVKMYVTGNWRRKAEIKEYATERIVFTGFLPSEEFNNLLANAEAVITGTTREYTVLMSGWEAVAYAKPLAVTVTATLKSLFGSYAVFYDWKKPESIAEAIRKIAVAEPNLEAREKLRRQTTEGLNLLKRRIKETLLGLQ
jgi:glycosyltransferase involved in cell wall biosynthesis